MKLNPELQSYFKGYEQCLDNFEERINYSISTNNGARTPQDVLQVLNDIIEYTHTQRLDMKRVNQPETPDKTFYVIVDNTYIH